MARFTEAFKELELLEDIDFDISTKDGVDRLEKFLNDEDEELDNIEMIVDLDAETEDDIKDTYVGSILLYCPTCHTIHYGVEKELITDEEHPDVVNVGEKCDHCGSKDGYEIIGKVAPYVPVEDVEDEEEKDIEIKDIEIDKVDDEEDDNVETSMLESLVEGDLCRTDLDENDNIPEIEDEDIDSDLEEKKFTTKLPKVSKVKENLQESLTEAPVYSLNPRYDSRKSFYGKAQVDTGDKNDQNKLYSYDTLVAEIKDSNPIVYGTFSQTTLRHIKDWLKQNGFKAESSKQIMNDYGVKNESCEDCKKDLKEEVQDEAYAIAEYVYDKIKGQDTVSWDEFEDLVQEGCKELYNVDLYNDANDDYKVTINEKEFDINDLVNGDIRGILSYKGYATIFEGENEGGLTTKDIEEGCKGKDCEKVNENLKESKSLKESAGDVYYNILDRAKMNIDSGDDVDSAIWDAIDNGLIYTADEFEVIQDLFSANDLYTKDGEPVSTYVIEHIYNEIYGDVQDYYDEKHENEEEEVEESLKESKEKLTKEQVLEHLNQRLKESSTQDDIDAKADDKKELAKKDYEKKIDDADADRDEEFDEELFESLVNKYCKKVYENVENFSLKEGYIEDNKIVLEGKLNYKSGKFTDTKFIFEEKETKDNVVRYSGLNETFAKGRKAFILQCTKDNNKLLSESLTYNFKTKVDGKTKTVYGRVVNKK